MSMKLPGGIRTKLALALLVIVGGALAAAYAIVIPPLRNSLINAKLDQLERDAATYAELPAPFFWPDYVSEASYVLDARVAIFTVASKSPVSLLVQEDSREESSRDVAGDEVAELAARTDGVARGTVERGGHHYAEVAFPAGPDAVVLVSAPLDDQEASVALVTRRMLAAAVVALGVALGLGYAAATFHARRIRRLQQAADAIGRGRFDEPIADDGDDELGDLARGFDRMRVQLGQLDGARKEFIANASHELRTPLFSLGGFVELMTDEELDEVTRSEFLVTMREQVDRLAKLATDLLDLSRVDAGGLRVARERVDLGDTARLLADEMRALAETSGHPLDVDLDGSAVAFGDEERVLQIGRALAGNALAHTPPGTPVRIRVRDDGTTARLEVEDDGPGIPPEHTARVFERFYRVEGGLASGSGLGLAIARELAELMGGRVTLDSRPGRTVFAVQLESVGERSSAREPAIA